MRAILTSAIVGLALTVSAASNAQAPAGSTGECKDGTYTTSESKKGACGGHGGVKDWYGTSAPAKSSSAPSAPAAAKASAPAMAAASARTVGVDRTMQGRYVHDDRDQERCVRRTRWRQGLVWLREDRASQRRRPAPTAAKAAAAPMAPAAPAPAAKTSTSPMAAAPAAGGGSGQVWVNTKSKVYHCPGTEWYGKTKAGEYMTESAAKAAGNHADHGKACS